ncbi:jhy protein homolog isoform X3 [Ictalurus furcatus]|uniref:jhy protein homolog isoform X3 n=1 Tax=Ictalurus furcatus TaxID=66913 RepID=UPI00234FF826|nr:jhy protein homolog isoform X3 [Ictalurus furcatus]
MATFTRTAKRSNTDLGDFYRSNDDKKRNMKSDQTRDARPGDEDTPHNVWDSLESDTESLVQEKAYQRKLQKCILNGVGENSSSYNDKSHNIERSAHEEGCDPQPDITETHGGQNTDSSRRMPPRDEYADLRYDPDWRKKLARSEFLQTNFSFDSNGDPGVTPRHAGHVSPRERPEYLIVHSPVTSEMNTVHPKPLQSSFHLHPPEDQDRVLSVLHSSSASLESMPHSKSDKTIMPKHRINHQQSAARIFPFSSPRQNQTIAQEQNIDKLNIVAMQRRHSENVRPTKLREDVVERNIATLGMNSHKQGSYLKAYEQRGGKQDDANQYSLSFSSFQPLQSAEDTASTDSPGSPDSALNPELMWIQKTQKLKTHNQSKRLDRARPHNPRTKPRGHLNQLVEKKHSQTPSEKQTLSSPDSGSVSDGSFSSAPLVNLNINLNTPAKLAEPFIHSESQKQLYTLVLPPSPQWKIRNDEYNSRFKGPSYILYLPLPPAGTVNQESIQVTNKNSIRISPTPFQESFTSNAPQLVVHHGEESRDSAYTRQAYSGAYPVLPPIGGSNNSDTELSSGRPEEATNTMHRSSSEGYLAQLEKQIQAKTTYKAYTLKEYKSLNRNVKLGGLGPSNTVAEDMAEKIRQQKLYSNVIREQNKKISRIPSLPTKNPVGRDNKNNIPRNKALEYAKTIAKPKAPQQLKERPKDKTESERVFEHSAYLQSGVDLTHMSTLEMLRKRHEQEKQVVAGFTSIQGKSSAPSVSSL